MALQRLGSNLAEPPAQEVALVSGLVSAVLLCLLTGGKKKDEVRQGSPGGPRSGGKVERFPVRRARWGLGGERSKLVSSIPNSKEEKMTGCHAN